MNSPLRITLVSGFGVLGGAELWALSILPATDRLAIDAVVLGEGPFADELSRLGIPVRVMPVGRRAVDVARAVFTLAAWLRSGHRPDVVLANGVKAAVVAAPAARLASVRCVWAKHDHSFDGHPIAALVARLVDGAVVTSPTLVGPSGRPDAVVVPPPRAAGPPLPRAQARAALADRGLDPADCRPVLAVVGRMVRYKGVEDAVRALAHPGGLGWRLAVIGDADPAESSEPERLRQLAATVGVADRVVFTGPVRDAASLLSGVDAVGVLTKPTNSGPGREGFASVATEAMLAGVPVIATSGGPVVGRLAGQAGLGVPPGDPVAVAAALGTLADLRRREAMGAAGRQLSRLHPSAEDCAGSLVRELARIACRPGAGRRDGPPISVITTVLNEVGTVERLLHRLVGQLTEAGDEVIVVDGGSHDGTVARVRAWAARDSRIRLVCSPGTGISAGRNIAVRAARNTLVACTDAGCEPNPGWLDAFRHAAAEYPVGAGLGRLFTGVYRAAAAGPVQTASAAVGYPDPDELRHPSPLVRVYGQVFGRCFDAGMPTGRSMAFDVSVWAAVGGFAEDLPTGEDVLFGQAAVGAGASAMLVSDAEVTWVQRTSLTATARMYHRYGEGSGRSRDPRLLGRDLVRLGAYTLAAALLARGGQTGRACVAVGAAGYLSLPLSRLLRRSRSRFGVRAYSTVDRIAAVPVLPLLAAVRDLAKVTGALRGLRAGRER